MHDNCVYSDFCKRVIEDSCLYSTFRSHPLYQVFQENLNDESAQKHLSYMQLFYPHLLLEQTLITSLDALGSPKTIEYLDTNSGRARISYPTVHNLKIAGDVEKMMGSLTGKTIVQIGAGDGTLCKIFVTLHRPARYCIVDLAPSLELVKTTLADWEVKGIELYTPETFVSQEPIDLVISSFAFTESSRELQKLYLKNIIQHAKKGYLDCRFPLRHFGVKVWTQEQIIAQLKSIGKHTRIIQQEPLTDIDHCLILFQPFD